ncbi:hypothetical protein Hanom_Chr05g00459501 [Helianthus anomalus]
MFLMQETRKKAKKARAHHKYNHHLSRNGYARLTAEIMQETVPEEEEIDRAMLWKRARETRGKALYTDEDIDGIREGCLSYGAAFVFK